MNGPKPEIEGIAVVLIGSFNPLIFHPLWFSKERLIQDTEAEKAEIKLISKEVGVFSIGWMGLEVTHDRFAITTNQPQYFEPLRDLVIGTFSLLRHTPIKQLGINKQEHYRCPNEDAWHTIGHTLVPKKHWESLLEKPGMRRLQEEGVRPDKYRGRILVTVEPSLKFMPGGKGVYFEVNDHYEIEEDGGGRSSDRLVDVVGNSWQESLARAGRITRSIMEIK